MEKEEYIAAISFTKAMYSKISFTNSNQLIHSVVTRTTSVASRVKSFRQKKESTKMFSELCVCVQCATTLVPKF